MASKKVFTVPFRRKREGKTNYKKRLSLLKSKSLRLVIRKSNKHILAQIINYGDQGDLVLKTAHSKELQNYGWKFNTGNLPSAYLTGLLLGKKSNNEQVIIDFGLQTPVKGSRIFAVVKGAIDAGMKIKSSEEVMPTEERISGKHIPNKATKISEMFEKTKHNILSGKKESDVKNVKRTRKK